MNKRDMHFPVWLRLLAVGGLLAGMADVRAGDELPYPEDPLGAHQSLTASPGRSAMTPGSDPCSIDGPKPAKWTLVDVIEQALCHNPQTRQAWANAKAQASQLGMAESAYLPSVNFNVPLSRSKNSAGGSFNSSIPVPGSTDNKAENTRIAPALSVNYLLLDFGGRAARVELARQTLEVANWTHASVLQNVLFAAIQAYFQMFAANAALEAAEATEKNSKGALDVAVGRYEVGTAALADKLQAQTVYSQARVSRQTAAGNARVALGVLANSMGLKPSDAIQFESPRLEGPDMERERDVQELIEQAKNSRPDLAAAEAQVRASEAGILSARSNSLPTLSLVGNYSWYEQFGAVSVPSWMVGVQFSVPLFTGFNNTYQIRNAEEQVESQAAARDQLEKSVELAVWQAYYTLQAIRENLRNTEELLKSAQQSEEVALGRYREGVGTIVELLNTVSNLANARYQFVQAHYNWRIGKAQLVQALGRLDLDDVRAVEGSRGILNAN